MNIKQLEDRIEEVQSEIDNFDKLEHTCIGHYEALLDEDNPVDVCGLVFAASDIIKALDPIAYRCWLADYADTTPLEEFEYYRDLVCELEELEDALSEATS